MGISGDIRDATWCNGITLVQNARDVGSIPALSTIFPIFMTLVLQPGSCKDMHCMVVEPTLCMYMCSAIACMYVIVNVSTKTLSIPEG